jgi:hypothetical protein
VPAQALRDASNHVEVTLPAGEPVNVAFLDLAVPADNHPLRQ